MYLATFFDRVGDGSVFMIFAPFSRDLWILLVIAIVTVFVLILFFEGYESHNRGGNFRRTSVFVKIFKWGILSGKSDSFRTWYTKFLLIGVGVFSINVFTCYTANLTVYLSQYINTQAEYQSVSDVISNGEKICTIYA